MGNRGKDVQAGGYDKWLVVAGLLVVMWLPAGVRASVEDYFNSGVTAARQQDYAVALRYFEAAERGGMREPLLYYNLGVSYYREGRLDQAESAFLQATKSPKLAAQSYYNLGLIARDRGLREQTITRFREAEAAAQTKQMRSLSQLALQQMTEEQSTEEASRPWLLWVEGGIGYDSNPALATDFITTTDTGSDQSLNFSAYGQYDFTRLRLHGLASADHYSEKDDLNIDVLETGASLPLNGGVWKFRPGLNLRHIRFGDESLQDSTALLLESSAPVAQGTGLKFYLEHEVINAASGYGHLEGTRDYFQTSLSLLEDRWRLVWDLEFNDREDLSAATGNFSSFSPRRRQWQLEYRNSLTAGIDLRLTTGLQNSRYADPEIRAGAVMQPRKDTRERLILELGYEHANDWRSKLELTYAERNSNFAEFDYDRSVLTLNVERSFGQ